MKKHLHFVLIFLLTATAIKAEEAGSLMLEIEGETFEFPLDAPQSDWSNYGSAARPYFSVNIYSRPTDEETWARFKQFTLGFEYSAKQVTTSEASLTKVRDDKLARFFGKDGLSVTVETAEINDEFLTLSGTVSGDLGFSKNYGREIDQTDQIPVSGTFSVTLGPVE